MKDAKMIAWTVGTSGHRDVIALSCPFALLLYSGQQGTRERGCPPLVRGSRRREEGAQCY